ncbi:alpha/beta hydrolase fold domain-containing protein [Colwellia sp. 12G3]|uniref:alpha/beta hydrolase fold domain-containing protein n=1 Tax=Colwellia sp. 12G3 TaxID=2058299 RepID=UPI0012FF4A36|nr:alpha/beta hydrolase fold domain-containing protein [Colwellia sp. 12G3]
MKYYLKFIALLLLVINLAACSNGHNEPSSETLAKLQEQAESQSVDKITPSKLVEYKKVDGISLSLHVFNPKGHKTSDNRPAIVFFHGGGWNQGHPSQFYKQSQYLADKGMVAISAEYRIKTKHGSTPKESVEDGKSAMRWVRAHAKELGINPKMIAAGGGSAGGHVAASTGTATSIEDLNDDSSVSYRPTALVLFNPVFDNGPGGYGHGRVKDYWQQFSPLHNITKDTPPTIGFFGEKDTAIKVPSVLKFEKRMKEVGVPFEMHIYKDQPHGFFNKAKYRETVLEMEVFLTKLGFITPVKSANSNTYYIDNKSGNDHNSALTPNKPWKSLKKINRQTFQPGDRILFKAGSRYNGVLEPKGNGTKGSPIIISSYGVGNKPLINGWGQKLHTLLLRNIEYWEVNNLSITNKGKKPQARRRGVTIHAQDIGELHHIVLNNLEIHQVNGNLKKKEGAGSGIVVISRGERTPSRFIDLQILNSHIHHVTRNGIGFHGNSQRDKWFPNLGVHIKGNLIEQVPGDGIVIIASDGAIIEHNILRDFPDTLPVGDAAAGIWPWSADNTIIQFNEVSGHKAKWDGQGFDSDFNSFGTIIQYNYSHDNYGGFLLVCNKGQSLGENNNKGTVDTIIRGNVSINDGIRPYPIHAGTFSPTFHITGPVENTQIYDNIIIVPKKAEGMDNALIDMDNWGGPWPVNTLFENNQFYFEDETTIRHKDVKSFIFKNNQLSKPIDGISINDNHLSTGKQFQLKELKRMALNKLEEYKNNE